MVYVVLLVVLFFFWQEIGVLKKRFALLEKGDPRIRALELRMDLLSRRTQSSAQPVVADPVDAAPQVVAPEMAAYSRPEPVPVAARTFRAQPAPAAVQPSPETRPYSEENPWRAPPDAIEKRHPHVPAPSPVAIPGPGDDGVRGGFEDLFGRRLPIWAGGITLAIAGMLIVKLSIESGMLNPTVRSFLSAMFGIGLIGLAELARGLDVSRRDPRIPQALAGAGVATLYGAVLMASLGYGLIGQGPAFALVAMITMAAGGLSLRFGPACALLGLVGGMVAPTLVGVTAHSVPLLAVYVAMVVAGLGVVARDREWEWLGVLSTAAGLLWATAMLVHADDPFAAMALGLMIAAVAIGAPFLSGRTGPLGLRNAGAVIGSVQMAALVAVGGFGALQWGLFGLLSALVVWLSTRDASMRRLPAIGLLVTAGLLLMWVDVQWTGMIVVLLGVAAIYGVTSVWRAWSDDDVEAGWLACATGAVVSMAPLVMFDMERAGPSAVAFTCSMLLGIAAFVGWPREDRTGDSRFSSMIGSSAVLAFVASCRMFGFDGVAASAAALSIALVAFAGVARDRRIQWWGAGLGIASVAGSSAVLGKWAIGGVQAVAGDDFVSSHAPALFDACIMLVPTLAAFAFASWRMDLDVRVRRIVFVATGVMATVLVHTLWKRTIGSLFAAEGNALGYLDRTVWEFGLASAAVMLAMRGRNVLSLVVGIAALTHFAVFSALVESPLWQSQYVGPILLVSFVVAGALVAGSRRVWTGWEADQVRSVVGVVLVSGYAFLQLRQLVNGDMFLSSGTTGTEEILRSLLAVSLGVGFLAWGLVRGDRTWRIASLGMMLFAAVKIFVFDASGLDGIARIGTFVALGFSLIGIGWIYSRYLPERHGRIEMP